MNPNIVNVAPTSRLVAGPGAATGVGALVKEIPGIKKVALVTDKGLVKAGVAEPIRKALARVAEVVVYDGILPDPSFTVVREGVSTVGDSAGTLVVALGGGSVLDAAKMICILATNGGDPQQYCRYVEPESSGRVTMMSFIGAKVRPIKKAPLPLIAIPTTSGTGSETNGGGVLTDDVRKRKVLFGGCSPAVVVLDPKITVGVPGAITAQTGFDALTHAIEALANSGANPYSNTQAMGAVRLLNQNLLKVVQNPKDVEARGKVQWAAHLAALAFRYAGGVKGGLGLGIVHAMGHAVGARLHSSHGQSLASILPHLMEFNLPNAAAGYARAAEALGVAVQGDSDERNARRAIDRVVELAGQIGVAKSLAQLGCKEDDIAVMTSEASCDASLIGTPRYPSKGDIETLYRSAMAGFPSARL